MKLSQPLKIVAYYQGQKIFDHIFDDYPITIGRSTKCDVPLSQVDFLSRQHCSVTMEDNKISIVDLDSSNGMYFNGQRVKLAVIEESLEIEIGELRLKFDVQENSLSNQETVVEEVTKIRPLDKHSQIKAAPEECPVVENKKEKTEKSDRIVDAFAPKTKAKKEKTKIEKAEAATPVPKNPFPPAKVAAPKPVFEALPKETPKAKKEKTAVKPKHKEHVRKSIAPNSADQFQKPHYQASQLRPQQRVLEGYVTWKDQIYDLSQYYPGQKVILGAGGSSNLELPMLKKNIKLATYDGNTTQVYIPSNLKFELSNEAKTLDFEESVHSPLVQKKSRYYTVKMGATDVVSVQITHDVFVHLKYIPTPRQLSRESQFMADEELKSRTFIAGAAHFLLFLAILLTEPKQKVHIKNVPDRYARLIVKPPEKKPEPPKPPEPKKEEKKIAEKKPEPKKVVEKKPKPIKIVKLQKSKVLAKVNKYPVEVAKPLKPADKPVVANIQAVGALAALNAFSSKAPSNVPVSVNINKNAGGQTALNTGGVIGALKTSSGKLAAGGLASVKTKGLGYGTGTGYGVQGIQGTAGGRSIAGTVVGQPALVHLSKDEGLTRAQVMEIVKQHMSQIQQCYERSLIENAKLSGRVEYEWQISAGGTVQWAKVKKSDVAGGDSLNNCVTGVFKAMKFPVAKNGQTTTPNIGFPFGRL